MIQNDYICTATGDTIVMQSVIMLGIIYVDNFADTTTNEHRLRYFDRKVQYSVDGGVTFSDWYDIESGVTQLAASNMTDGTTALPLELMDDNALTQLNLLLQANACELVFRFQYRRVGIDNTGEIDLNAIQVNGSYVERSTSFNISAKSPLKTLVYNNIDVMNLLTNLTQKMYAEGIVPSYIERNEEETIDNTDEDYVDFWQVIAGFYSTLMIDSYKFENIYWKRSLLCEYLRQKNVFFCNCNDIVELQLIAKHFFDEMRVRGTTEIFHPQGYEYTYGSRNIYKFSNTASVDIMPQNPVRIDGVVYTEEYALPTGWTLDRTNNQILAPDLNTHRLELTAITSTDPTAFTQLPTRTNVSLTTKHSSVYKRYNGEYLRLICFNYKCDEFIYNNVDTRFLGWCLNNSSPMYKGLRPQRNVGLVKAYESTDSIVNLSLYPVLDPTRVFKARGKNPRGESDTVMLMRYNLNQVCFPEVIPIRDNIITDIRYLLKFNSATTAAGTITVSLIDANNNSKAVTFNLAITNGSYTTTGAIVLPVSDTAYVIVTATYDATNYSVAYDVTTPPCSNVVVTTNFTYSGVISGYCLVGALRQTINGITGTETESFNFAIVDDTTLFIVLNFVNFTVAQDVLDSEDLRDIITDDGKYISL